MGVIKVEVRQAGVRGIPGFSAYTTTIQSFLQPPVDGSCTVTVANSDWVSAGLFVFIQGAGYYLVLGKTGIQVNLRNLGYEGNADPGRIINSTALVSPAGPRGAPGANATGSYHAFSQLLTGGVSSVTEFGIRTTFVVEHATPFVIDHFVGDRDGIKEELARPFVGYVSRHPLTNQSGHFAEIVFACPYVIPDQTVKIFGRESED